MIRKVSFITFILTLCLLNLGQVNGEFAKTFSTPQAYTFMKLCGAAYAPDPRTCLSNILPTSESWSVIGSVWNINCSSTETCAFFAAKSDVTKQILISFRGSYGYTQIPNELFQTLFFRGNFLGGKVQRYFYDAFNATWPYVEPILSQYSDNSYTYFFTGHSLGGALAALSSVYSVDLNLTNSNNTYVYTFGEPRVGNPETAAIIDQLVPNFYRVVNKADIIPHVPPCIPNGLASCASWSSGYYHHNTEHWYYDGAFSLNSYYTVCDANESPNCSNSLVLGYSYSNHAGEKGYFKMDPQVFGAGNCVGETVTSLDSSSTSTATSDISV